MIRKLICLLVFASGMQRSTAFDVVQTIKDNPKMLLCVGGALCTYFLDWKMENDGHRLLLAGEKECKEWNGKHPKKTYTKTEWKDLKKHHYFTRGRNPRFIYNAVGNIPVGYEMNFHSGRTGVPIKEIATISDRKPNGDRDLERVRQILPYGKSYFFRNLVMGGLLAWAVKGKTSIW